MLAIAFVVGTTGCAAMRPMTASSADLDDYQKTRLATSSGEHLARCEEYLARHPNGAWADEVRGTFATEEAAYFEHAQTSRARAIEYLTWLPQGPHADAALAVVRAFDGHVEDDEMTRLMALARTTSKVLDAQAAERKEVQDELLAAISAIARAPLPLAVSDAGDLFASLQGSRASTWGSGSERRETYSYVLPNAGQRTLTVTFRIEQEGGQVVAAELSANGLFERLAELGGASDPARYVDEVVSGAVGKACTALDPLTRRCNNTTVRILPGEPDRFRASAK